MANFIPRGLGWIPDLPSPRDFTYRHPDILSLLRILSPAQNSELPEKVDLRRGEDGEVYLTDPEDQGPINCSASFAVLSLVEYFERRMRGNTFEGSTRFLYKVTRNIRSHGSHSVCGDTGADLRTTLAVLATLGVPPEEVWPYVIERFDEEPTPMAYYVARPFSNVRYFRLDEPNGGGAATWKAVKSFLAAGFPIAFGFTVPTSLTADANIHYRAELDRPRGGQAIVAIGYSDHHFGHGQHALLVRSSWGTGWGDRGNGWLPIAYVQQQLARDFWTIVSERWLDASELSQPSIICVHEEHTSRPSHLD